MPYQITAESLNLSPRLTKLANEKLSKIEKFTSTFGDELKDVRMVISKGPRWGYRVKVEVWVPNAEFVAREGGFSLEGTMDTAIDEVVRQIKRHKGKLMDKDRRLFRHIRRKIFFPDVLD